MLEDYSFASVTVDPPDELFERVTDCDPRLHVERGFDPEYGSKLVHELEAVGLEEVDADGRARVSRGGSPGTAFIRLSIDALRDALVAAGALTEDEIEQALARVDDPENVFTSPLMIAAWGRKPS